MKSRIIRKRIICVLLALMAAFCLCLPVSADMGPKPGIELKLKNPPDEVYYIDLLMQDEERSIFMVDKVAEKTMEFVEKDYPDETAVYDRLMKYNEDGWRPRFGSNIGGYYFRSNDKHTYEFDYDNVPEDFKVIISTASGKVIVSDECHVDAYNATVSYDLKTGEIKETTKAEFKYLRSLFITFAATFLITLLVELLVVRKFKYPMNERQNLLVVILTNLTTQIFLYAMIEFVGLNIVITEAIIFVVEAVIFAVLLVPRHVTEGIWCALCANIISCIATVPVWFIVFISKAFSER